MIAPIESPTARFLFSKQPAHPPQDTVLLGIIGVVFARYFEDGWEGGGVGIDAVAYTVGDLEWKTRSGTFSHLSGEGNVTCVLVYQDNPNVLALNELVESGLYGGVVGLVIHHQEVLLRVWACGHMLSECQVQSPAASSRETYTNAGEEQTGY